MILSTGTSFEQYVETVVEAFNSMQGDLNKEKKVLLSNGLNEKSRLIR